MKRFKIFLLLWVGVALCIFTGQASASSVTFYDGLWTATDSSIFTLNLDSAETGYFFLYDISGDGVSDSLNVFENNPLFANVYFTMDSSSVLHASLTPGDTSGTTSVALASQNFGFFFSPTADGSVPIYGYGMEELNLNQYCLTSAGLGMSVVVDDISPVPIPGAAWVLGAGLVGLLGLRRKRLDY